MVHSQFASLVTSPLATLHSVDNIPISNKGESPNLDDVPIPPLPAWLAPTFPKELPKFPQTKEQLELERMVFETFFETVLDRVADAVPLKTCLDEYPTKIDSGRFRRWIRADKTRQARFEESQEISTDVIIEIMDEIASGVNQLEDIERAKLRLSHEKFKLQSWNKRRYGNEKETPTQFGSNGITINITGVESPYQTAEKIVNG